MKTPNQELATFQLRRRSFTPEPLYYLRTHIILVTRGGNLKPFLDRSGAGTSIPSQHPWPAVLRRQGAPLSTAINSTIYCVTLNACTVNSGKPSNYIRTPSASLVVYCAPRALQEKPQASPFLLGRLPSTTGPKSSPQISRRCVEFLWRLVLHYVRTVTAYEAFVQFA